MVVEGDDAPAQAPHALTQPSRAQRDDERAAVDDPAGGLGRAGGPGGTGSADSELEEASERVVGLVPAPASASALAPLPTQPEAAEPAAAGHPQIDLPLEEAAPMPGDVHADPRETPSFVRQAERAARWRRPWVRAALGVACATAGLALAGQWMFAQRDSLAARSSTLKPLLAAGCAAFGCTLQAPRALDALRVESSGLARVEKSELYRLSVALRNLRGHEVALPAFELALTDTQGQLIARRVLRAEEIGARASALAGSGELMLQATIQVGSGTVAGYTIELFYP